MRCGARISRTDRRRCPFPRGFVCWSSSSFPLRAAPVSPADRRNCRRRPGPAWWCSSLAPSVSRWDPRRSPCPRGGWWWRSSPFSRSAVVVDARAHPHADAGCRTHRQPSGSMWDPLPARMLVVVLIVVLPGQPLSSMRTLAPARMCDVVRIVSPTGRSSTGSRRAGWSWCSSWCSWSAVVVDAGAHARANARRRGHRHPIGSMTEPPPARRPGRGGHRAAPGQPLPSMRAPAPARMLVVVFIVTLTVRRCRPCGRPRPREGWSACSSRSPLPDLSRWGRASTPGRRGSWWWCSSPVPRRAVGIDPPSGAGTELRGGGHRLLPPHPLGSSAPLRPARTVVVVLIVLSIGGWDARQPSGSIAEPTAARRCVRVCICRLRQPSGSSPGPSPARSVVVVCIGSPLWNGGPEGHRIGVPSCDETHREGVFVPSGGRSAKGAGRRLRGRDERWAEDAAESATSDGIAAAASRCPSARTPAGGSATGGR